MSWKTIQLFVHYQLLFLLFSHPAFTLETDTVSSTSTNSVIKDPDAIVSRGNVFKLGFFTLENTANRYLGIFHAYSETTPIWIANNRNAPLLDSSSSVSIANDGNLILINSRYQTVWSTNLANTTTMNTTLQITDSGNLVLFNQATGDTLWESFSHPSECFLPTMKMYRGNFQTFSSLGMPN